MWVLLEEPRTEGRVSSELLVQQSLKKWGLVPGSIYKIGRMEGDNDITCPQDSSVSKRHASITVMTRSPQARPEVVLEDVGSKYGTHLNDGILAESQRLATNKGVSRALKKPRVMSAGDRVRFGVAYSIFRLMWIDLEVTGSMLRDKEERSNLAGWLEPVGAKLQDSMTDKTSHLVMSNISLSIKVVNCLAKGVPIVTSQFFRDLGQSIKTRQPLPLEENFVPPVSNNSSESVLRDPSISFQVNYERAKLFAEKRIIFFDKKQFQQNRLSCQLAGADVIMWGDDMDIGSITREDVVIKPVSVSNKETWVDVSTRLTSLSLAPCPHTDLYLAIVHCSTAHHCNPARRSKLLGGATDVPDGNKMGGLKVLAADTCSVSGTPQSRSGSRVQVSETPSAKVSTDPVARSVKTPTLVETQVLETQSRPKRRRSSQKDEDTQQPPSKVSNIVQGQRGEDSRCRSPDDIFSKNDDKAISPKDNSKSPVELFTMSKQIESQDEIFSKDDDEEDDLFGFGGVQPKKKRVLSPPEKSQFGGTQQKRPRHEVSIEDDLFGFEPVKKESPEPPIEEKKMSLTPDVSNGPSVNREENNKKRPELEYVEYSRIVQSSDGFIGKPDIIKKEVKEETLGDSEVSALSVTVAMISMLRPSTSRPSYVEHPDPKQHGRPVANFKRFKKQQFDKPRTAIALKTHILGNNDQTRIEDWFKDNTVVTAKEDEAEETSKKAEEFWDFESSQANKHQRKTNPFSRSKR